MSDKNIKNNGLFAEDSKGKDVNLDDLEQEYISSINKIFKETKHTINNYDEIQKNNFIVDKWFKNKFDDFVSTLRGLGIKLSNSVNLQNFKGHDPKEIIKQIYSLNMSERCKKQLFEECLYYHCLKNEYEENEIKACDFGLLRKHIKAEEVFTQRFKCLILICKNKMYEKIHNDAKKLLNQIVAGLKKNELMFNDKIKDKIDKGMIAKYGSVVSKLYEEYKSEMNKIFFEAARIKNQCEVTTILKQLEYQDKIKAEEEQKKQEELKQENNEPKDKSKTEKNDNTKEKNKNEKTSKKNNIGTKDKVNGNKKNNQQHKSDKKSSSPQIKPNDEVKNKNFEIKLDPQKDIEEQEKQKNQRIIEIAESSYFHEMLWSDFYNYHNSDKEPSLEQADICREFRNLSMFFANSIKIQYSTSNDLMLTNNFQSKEMDTFLVKYLLDNKFDQFKFKPRPRKHKGITDVNVENTTDGEIGYFAQDRIENIVKESMSLIFDHPDYQKIAGAAGGPAENNDCFILSILSHLSSQKVEEIKKFVDKHKICTLYIKDNRGEIKEQTLDLFDTAGGNSVFISDTAKTIAYMRAALAIKIVKNWNKFPDGDPERQLNIKDLDEFLTLLGNGPLRDENNKITRHGQRQISGESHLIAQAVADLTERPFLLIYQTDIGQTGYFLTTKGAVSRNEIETYHGMEIGNFKFDDIYTNYVRKRGRDAQQSECIKESNKILTERNEKLLELIDDPNVISIRLSASVNIKTGNTCGHFWAIGRNYMGETLTTQKNWDVFGRLNVEKDFQSNSGASIKNVDQLGFTEKNKNMPSLYFLANANNIQGLEDIIDFLRRLYPKNIKTNFDKWFKHLLCSTDGKIDENDEYKFKNQIIKLFYSQDKNNNLYKDGNKVLGWCEVINNFSSYVPSQFHFKWFQIVYQLLTDPISFYKNTVIGKLANIKLENDNGMKYFGYLIGKFVESVKNQETYEAWKKNFIDGDYLENEFICKNDIENRFLSLLETEKFIGYDNQDIVDNLLKFIRLFDPSDLYMLIGVVEKEKNCDALKPLYNLSPKTVNKFCNLFRNFVLQKGKNQNEINKEGDKKENKNDNIIKKQDDIRNAHINLIKLLGEINSQNPNGMLDEIISDSKSFEELRDSLKNIKSIVDQGGKNCNALKPLYNLSPKTVSKFFTLFREFVAKEKNKNEIKNDENSNNNDIKEQDNIENAHINLIKLLGEINSQNPNGIFDQIISNSKSFEELRVSLKTIKSIVDQGDGAKNFLFALNFKSLKKALDNFKQEQEKKGKEKEKKENKQQSFWDFIKDKNYERNDIQKIVSVSNSLDEIKNNLEELNNDELPMYLCKKYHEVENKKNIFWKLYTSMKSNISKIFSLFKNNGNQDVQDKQSLEYIASALNKDGDEGENARIMFYTMSKNMGQEKMKQLWEQVEKYMAKNKENNENNEKSEEKEEEINTNTK